MGVSVPVTVTTSAGTQMVSAGAGRIVFTSVAETSGVGVAGFTLFDGNPGTAQGLLIYSLNAAESSREAWPEHGVPFEGDLWMGATAGAAEAIIHVVPADLWSEWKADYWHGIERALMMGGAS